MGTQVTSSSLTMNSVKVNTTELTPGNPSPSLGLISGSLYWQIMGVVLGLDIALSVFATGANILTIIVYNRLGYTDSINISLSALAVSDLGVAVTTIVCVLGVVLPIIPSASFTYEIFVNLGANPHITFSRASALITTYVSVERYLCVLLPLKVKSIFTPKRTLASMVVIFALMFAPMPVTFLRYPMGWKYSAAKNKSVLGVLAVSNSNVMTAWYIFSTYSSMVLPILTFAIVIVNTVLLATSLQKSKAWRDANRSQSSTTAGKKGGAFSSETKLPEAKSKETKAVKMVIAIATVFIVATIPSSVNMIAIMTVPGFHIGGRFSKLHSIAGMLLLGVDSANSGANVIIYLYMSSKFRNATLSALCGKSEVRQA
ncbi:alpha-1A adrenergic receptor [Elysia marginata]|uniref:Alpha-1A adrenergic receptor n=1 Tax=Elysia marginata TaxID=1093978 RepID=A0AAV4FNF9_9GAST|nr:alpha-1A adrenergic receptor [Elysia marginata]